METGQFTKDVPVWHLPHGHRFCKTVATLLIRRPVKYEHFPEITLGGQMDFMSSADALMMHIHLPVLTL